MASSSSREEEGSEVEEEEEEEEGSEVEEEEEEEEEGCDEEAPSHLPLAPPSSELPDISTTVDPSYIISLIRHLLPCDVRVEKKSAEIDSNGYRTESQSLDQTMTGVHDCGNMAIATKTPAGNGIVEEDKIAISWGKYAEHSDIKDSWEDAGCTLWDLSASRTHAELMVNNLVLEVLLANLRVSRSFRITEICLGIIGNLACHNALSDMIISTNGLIETAVDQLFLDDSACLSETFRLLAVGLQGSGFASWATVLLPEKILQRLLWITENTLNCTLLERSIEFFLAIINNQEVANVLLPPLFELGLPNLVVSLLTCELSKLKDEYKLARYSILEAILRLVEALSIVDIYPQVISSNEELLHIVCDVVRLPDKIEVASSCVSAVIIIANLLLDLQHLTPELSQDLSFMQGLLDVLPFVSEDIPARNALWSILARLLIEVQENNMSIQTISQLAFLFVNNFSVIEEDVDGHPTNNLEEQGYTDNKRSHEIVTALKKISWILQKWITEKPDISKEYLAGREDEESKVNRLLNYLSKHGL